MSKLSFHNVNDGELFEVAGIQFIKFPEVDGKVPAVARDLVFESQFGDSNDFTCSAVRKRLEDDFLLKIVEAVGKENLCPIKTDLTALDGLKPYPVLESLVSLPTFDFYRANVSIFDKYPVDDWWWTATPDSAPPHDAPRWVVCVAPSGSFDYDFYNIGFNGVRPFLLFESSIFDA